MPRALPLVCLTIALGPGCEADAEAGGVAPTFLSFTADRSEMRTGEEVTFSAIVTDPQGIADLIGGTLQTENGDTYNSFATSGDEGAYSVSTAWTDIDRLALVPDFTGSTDLTFQATFYDVAGHSTVAATTISLECPSADAPQYCDGAGDGTSICQSLQEDASNCGSCGNDCVANETEGGTDPACEGGTCVHTVEAQCSNTLEVANCNEFCSSGVCVETRLWHYTNTTCAGDAAVYPCDFDLTVAYGHYISCVCRQPV